MFCGKCGTQLEDGTEFCPNCGENLGAPKKKIDASLMKYVAIAGGVIAILLVAILLLGSISSPKKTIKVLWKDLKRVETKSKDYKKYIKGYYGDDERYLTEDGSKKANKKLRKLMQKNAQRCSYKIETVEKDDDLATVELELKYYDCTDVYGAWMEEYEDDIYDWYFSSDYTEEEIVNLLIDSMCEAFKDYKDEMVKSTEIFEIKLYKKDGVWQVDESDWNEIESCVTMGGSELF